MQKKLTLKQIISLVLILFILVLLPVAIFLSQQKQEIRKKAAGNGMTNVTFLPSTGTLTKGSSFNLDIRYAENPGIVGYTAPFSVSGAEATVSVPDSLIINSANCVAPFNGLTIANISGQTVTFMCAIPLGATPPGADTLGQTFAALNLTVSNATADQTATVTFTHTRVTQAGVTGSAPDLSDQGSSALFTLSAGPTITPIPTIPASHPTNTPIPKSGVCTSDSQCADNQYCASNCGADVCPPLVAGQTGVCATVTCPKMPTSSDSCKTQVITNHACIMQNAPDGTFCYINSNAGNCSNGICTDIIIPPTITPTPSTTITPVPSGYCSTVSDCPISTNSCNGVACLNHICSYSDKPDGTTCVLNGNKTIALGICQNGVCQPPPITIPPPCQYRQYGDADCNGSINLIDFEIWRREFTGLTVNGFLSDFNFDGQLNLVDFEIWRRNLGRSFPFPTGPNLCFNQPDGTECAFGCNFPCTGGNCPACISLPGQCQNQICQPAQTQISCTSDSQCPAGQACQATMSMGTVYPAGSTITPSPEVILQGICKITAGGNCISTNDCFSGLTCHLNTNGTSTCTSPVGGNCSGPSDTSCPSGYTCIQGCGSPVGYPGAPTPGYFCEVNELANEPRNCPICLSEDTRISTPNGEIPVTDLSTGMVVWSVDEKGNKIQSKIIKLGKTSVLSTHRVYELKLADGRVLKVSPDHPLANGNPIQSLHVGDKYDNSSVTNLSLIPYHFPYTYDLLPDGPTGIYFANGIEMGTTLK